ncbi:hypothetical protein FQN60_002189, partial [Etheostoma spectabile]
MQGEYYYIYKQKTERIDTLKERRHTARLRQGVNPLYWTSLQQQDMFICNSGRESGGERKPITMFIKTFIVVLTLIAANSQPAEGSLRDKCPIFVPPPASVAASAKAAATAASIATAAAATAATAAATTSGPAAVLAAAAAVDAAQAAQRAAVASSLVSNGTISPTQAAQL